MALAEALIAKLLRPPNVLLVEDDVDVGTLFSQALHESCECEVDWALDGERAIDYLSARRYDIVFLDLMLPKINGVEVLRYIKQVSPSLPVIVVTGYVGSTLWAEATSLGVFGVLAKPPPSVNFGDVFRMYNLPILSKAEAQECAQMAALG